MDSSFLVTTNWCAINKYKANAYNQIIKNSGLYIAKDEDDASDIIFLMCSFTGEREEDSITKIKQLQSQGKKVIIAWCTLPEITRKLNDVDVIQNEITPFNNFRTYLLYLSNKYVLKLLNGVILGHIYWKDIIKNLKVVLYHQKQNLILQ